MTYADIILAYCSIADTSPDCILQNLVSTIHPNRGAYSWKYWRVYNFDGLVNSQIGNQLLLRYLNLILNRTQQSKYCCSVEDSRIRCNYSEQQDQPMI